MGNSGISRYAGAIEPEQMSEVFGIGLEIGSRDRRPQLVTQAGKLGYAPNQTALTGTLVHYVNTEPGWSGTPLLHKKNGVVQICGMHIAAFG